MTWDAIGAIAELLGAIGVIASLVYLASQIRDTRRALRSSTYQQVRADIHTTMNSVVANPDLFRSVNAIWNDLGTADQDDAFRFVFWITGVIHSFDNCYYQYRSGMLDEERWEMHRRDLSTIMKRPKVAEWWRSGLADQTGSGARSNLSPAFVELVSEILNEPAP